jgi:hypothetical protein
MNGSSGPEGSVSIVVVSLLGGETLERCLRALEKIDCPFMVVSDGPAPHTGPSASARITHLRTDVSVPRKRHLGVSATRSEWVALLEDTCEISGSWLAAVKEIARRSDLAAVGGPVVIDTALSPRTMALACMEYGEFAPECATEVAQARLQPAARIAGLNLLYRRDALPPLAPGEGLIETEVNAAIREKGGRIAVHPALRVTYCAEDHASATLCSRYVHGRIYGGGQRAQCSIPARVLAIAKCAALPLLLFARAAGALPPAYRRRFRAWGWTLAFALAWSAGEGVGLALGRGDSLEAWR